MSTKVSVDRVWQTKVANSTIAISEKSLRWTELSESENNPSSILACSPACFSDGAVDLNLAWSDPGTS